MSDRTATPDDDLSDVLKALEEPLERANLRALLEEDTPPPIIYRYKVAAVLPMAVETLLNEMREAVGLGTAPPGFFALSPDFTSETPEPLLSALGAWAAAHLPLPMQLTLVEAQVVGQQRYVAGFALDAAEALGNAQKALAAALSPHCPAAPFMPIVPVSDATPAALFPRLIHAMQNAFAPQDCTLAAVELLRVPEGDDRWEVVQKF